VQSAVHDGQLSTWLLSQGSNLTPLGTLRLIRRRRPHGRRGLKRLLVMEAKNTVYAPVAGTVKQLLVQPGQHVEAKDLLVVIE
jgi:multidrug efflux pump subunit AcrA (membrane-fusion protein)